ncbi:hypothetical protein [Priestia megaterium]|uniref:hypothetical protein n=1 Tax=Priestia megaterium TaxID=1404 RepID=UPI001126DCF9|nr:hypothetical protein [Priestia megaterium]TPF18052.1 hypothetical protein CBE78_02155 [Priestia megaterium]TPF22159.1 hypothetical protein CBE79_04660 [Priestia megaterium]
MTTLNDIERFIGILYGDVEPEVIDENGNIRTMDLYKTMQNAIKSQKEKTKELEAVLSELQKVKVDEKPAFSIGEVAIIRTLKTNIKVTITDVIVKKSMSKGVIGYYYNFTNSQYTNGEPWNWKEVPEQNIKDMIWEAKNYKRYENRPRDNQWVSTNT